MTKPVDLPALIDQLGAIALECRQLLSDVRSATKDMRATIKEAKATRDELASAVKTMVTADVEAVVKEHIEDLGRVTHEAMNAAAAKVQSEFDKLANIMMTGNAQGRGDFDLRKVIGGEKP